MDDLPQPTEDEDRYERVHRVLRRYDEHLTEAEREFLKRFSVFRTPVARLAFSMVFGERESDDLETVIQRLIAYRILRYHPYDETYTTHPLIRNHYFALFTRSAEDETQATHERIRNYYLELADDTPRCPTLDDLRPLIEAVHHACRAGAYDEAHRIRRNRIDQGDRFVLAYQLGAYQTQLMLCLEFFPNADSPQEPQGSEREKLWILNTVAFCLMSLGRLREALPFYQRKNAMPDGRTSRGYQNLARLHLHLGDLDAGAAAAREALRLAHRVGNQFWQCQSLAHLGLVRHLAGDLEGALEAFAEAESIEREREPDKQYLYSDRGILHADILLRVASLSRTFVDSFAYARRITKANLEICERERWPDDLSRSHRVLGDIIARAPRPEDDDPRTHYDEALRIARSITERAVLIEALIARGCHVAKAHVTWAEAPQGLLHASDLEQACADLREALELATRGGYRIYEADTRVALAWAYRAAADPDRARAEAERAQAMSEATGYHWGQVDAEEVLRELGDTA